MLTRIGHVSIGTSGSCYVIFSFWGIARISVGADEVTTYGTVTNVGDRYWLGCRNKL